MARLFTLTILAVLLSACDTAGPEAVSDVQVEGTYSAASFRLLDASTGALRYDLMAAGSTFQMTLADDGTVAGAVFIPYRAFVESGTTDDIDDDFDVAFSGTYQATDKTLTFETDADTFVDVGDWEILDGGRGLRFEDSEDGMTFELVVAR